MRKKFRGKGRCGDLCRFKGRDRVRVIGKGRDECRKDPEPEMEAEAGADTEVVESAEEGAGKREKRD